MKIVTASEKLSKRFFKLLLRGDTNTFSKLDRYLDRKYPNRAEFSYFNPVSESSAFILGLRAGEKYKNWLMLEDDFGDGHTVFIPDTERDFAVWLIDNFFTEEE